MTGCHTTIHCANHDFCHRCWPEMAEASAHVVKALQVLPERKRGRAYMIMMALLTGAAERVTPTDTKEQESE